MKPFFKKRGYLSMTAASNASDKTAQKKISPLKEYFKRIKKLKILPKLLTKKENTVIQILTTVMILSLIGLCINWYTENTFIVPDSGGEYIEGVLGTPSLINPILAQTNEVDRDITRLLFNGLFEYVGGKLTPNLASNMGTVSEDRLTYTFSLRKDALWHDSIPFTAEDVVFTVQNIQNPEFKSPLYNSLLGITVKQIDAYTVSFTLSEPYAPFTSLLTFGILPAHIWQSVPPQTAHLADYNLKTPIGTGPFKIKSFKKDGLGVIKSYTLIKNEEYFNDAPFLETITFKFYPDYASVVEALNNDNIDGINYLPSKYLADITNKNVSVRSLLLPQYAAIFFNTTKNQALQDKDIRKALSLALNRDEILKTVLDNQGTLIEGPILPGFIGYDASIQTVTNNRAEAAMIIEKLGWEKITQEEFKTHIQDTSREQEATATPSVNISSPASPLNMDAPLTQNYFWQKNDTILSITLTTVDNPETAQIGASIKKQWEEIGVQVTLEVIEKNSFLRDIVKPRLYEALLFGLIVGNDPDPYPFWHSSQINDPGVNLALYSNKAVDTLLEEARKTINQNERAQKYREFQKILKDDTAAIFLYNPTYPYILHNNVHNFSISRIAIPADRFTGIEKWYIKTKRTFKPKN